MTFKSKKKYKTLIVIALLFVFKTSVYKLFFSYKVFKERKTIELVNKKLKNKVDKQIQDKNLKPLQVLDLANQITCKNLSFTFHKALSNPNELYFTKKANCIGYAQFCSAVGNYILEKQNIDAYYFTPAVAEIEFLGFNVHRLFSSPFFKNHDIVLFVKVKEGNLVATDPSLSDYTGIKKVRLKF